MFVRNYFAAANGYSGFRSYFRDVFGSNNFKRVYVLKGGPGTGKSTLMKRISAESRKNELDYDNIYCSSDPKSLDGVIVHTEKGDYAIIDGTAPHERDAVIPGAIDVLINLGDNFNNEFLSEHRKEILKHTKAKKDSYINAYTMLKSAGAISQRINCILRENLLSKKAESFAESLLSRIDKKESVRTEIALMNAFCKDGICKAVAYHHPEKSISFSGTLGEQLIILNVISNKSKQTPSVVSYDPLDENLIDGILIGDTLLYASSDSDVDCIEAKEFIDAAAYKILPALDDLRKMLLGEARRHFTAASQSHFALESIYSKSVCFDKNDELCERIIKEIF